MIESAPRRRPDCRQLLNTMTEWAIDGQVVTQMTDGLNDRLIAIKSRETYIRVNTFETMITENMCHILLTIDNILDDFWEFFYTYFCLKFNYLILNF